MEQKLHRLDIVVKHLYVIITTAFQCKRKKGMAYAYMINTTPHHCLKHKYTHTLSLTHE